MVQHPSIAPPFLDERTLVDANAKTGFMQSSPLPNPEQPKVEWPNALNNGKPVDLRRLTNESAPDVVSYTIDDDYGWVTASSVSNGLLIGYLWKTSDYPWFNAWRQHGEWSSGRSRSGVRNHRTAPAVFDSCQEGPDLRPAAIRLPRRGSNGVAVLRVLPFRIPRDYKGVSRVTYAQGRLQLQERDGGRELTMVVGDLFAE